MIQYVRALKVFFNVGYFFVCKGVRCNKENKGEQEIHGNHYKGTILAVSICQDLTEATTTNTTSNSYNT